MSLLDRCPEWLLVVPVAGPHFAVGYLTALVTVARARWSTMSARPRN